MERPDFVHDLPYPDWGDRFYLGLDLGQSEDYTALAVVRRLAPPGWIPDLDARDCPVGCRFELQALKRYRLGTSYPAIVDDVAQVCARLADTLPLRRPPSPPFYKKHLEEWVRWVDPSS
jgi:hypothetical protein